MWADLLRSRPSDRAVLALCAVVLVVHQLAHRAFIIDDAAISFTFARNIAAGEGVVPWPGGERIESFSNPTWVAILALFQLVGLSGFEVAKPLAILFGLLTMGLVWRLARLAMPDHEGPAPLFAPMVLAMSSQFAIWSASGLENALFCLLLALAIERTVTESRWGGFWGSALAWLALAWSRPEGIVFAACGGFWFLAALVRARRSLRPVVGWLAVFWVPTLLLEALRLWYFAWPVPQTYYAKIVTRSTFPLSWNQRGWGQAREFAGRLWQGWFLPVYLVGLVGWRKPAAIAAAVVGVALLYPAPEALSSLPFWPPQPRPPEIWLMARIVLLTTAIVALPLLEVGRPGWDVRVLCWHTAGLGLLFSVYANGDWMGGYRWMSLFVPPVAVLFATGLRQVVDAVERWLSPASGAPPASAEPTWGSAGWIVAALGIGLWLPPNLSQTRDHRSFNGDETAIRLIMRADYTDSVRKRTFYEGTVHNLEMDQGGTTWRRPDYVQVDMAGLVDIPMAHHNYGQRKFIEEHVFEEHPPTFGHVHGWWAQYSGFATYPQWSEYFALPPHPDLPPAPIWHDGMWASRGLLFEQTWPHDPHRVEFDQDIALHGLVAPAAPWAAGGEGYLELGLSSPSRPAGRDLRLVGFLARDGAVAASWELPLGYGLLGMDQWRGDEVFVGRYAVPIPAGLAPGRYDLGVVLLDPDGAVLPAGGADGARPVDPALLAAEPVFARGEVRLSGGVEIGDQRATDLAADQTRDEALALAASARCEEAEARWILAKRHRPRAWPAHEAELPVVKRALAACWATRAEQEPDRAAELLAKAHRWDHESPEVERVGAPVGERLWTEGIAAREAGDAEVAYRRFTALLGFQPWRSWARRYAEEARDIRLGIDHDVQAPIPAAPPPNPDDAGPGDP